MLPDTVAAHDNRTHAMHDITRHPGKPLTKEELLPDIGAKPAAFTTPHIYTTHAIESQTPMFFLQTLNNNTQASR